MRNPHPFDMVIRYAESMSTSEPDYLKDLERETYLKMLSPQMLSGHHLGRFLSIISTLVRPKTIVEIGTYTGYATLCLCEGLEPDGMIHTYEINHETEWLFKKYLARTPYDKNITQTIGDALDHIPQLDEGIDLSWIDADKKLNNQFYESILAKTRKGGLIMIDNTLWSGKVMDDDKDETTQAIHDLNKKLSTDERVTTVLIPIRDGITLVSKR